MPGECWAIEAELTPKPLARTAAIMAGLLARTADYQPAAPPGPGPRYDRVVYLAAPAARSIVDRAAASPARRAAVPAGGAGPARRGGAVMWWYLRARLMLWLLRVTGRVLRWAVLAAVLVAAAPVTVVAAVGFAGAWLRGWPPAKLRRAACWSLPMTGVYLAGRALQVRTWQALALAPVHDWRARLAPGGRRAGGDRVRAVRPGRGPGRAVRGGRVVGVADLRHRERAGRARPPPPRSGSTPGSGAAPRGPPGAGSPPPAPSPSPTGGGRVVMGATIRAVGHRWQPVTAVPYRAMSRHQVIIGASGCGKTNLMMRSWAGWYAAALRRPLPARGGPAAADRAGLQRRPRRPHQSRPHPDPAARRRGRPGGDLAR